MVLEGEGAPCDGGGRGASAGCAGWLASYPPPTSTSPRPRGWGPMIYGISNTALSFKQKKTILHWSAAIYLHVYSFKGLLNRDLITCSVIKKGRSLLHCKHITGALLQFLAWSFLSNTCRTSTKKTSGVAVLLSINPQTCFLKADDMENRIAVVQNVQLCHAIFTKQCIKCQFSVKHTLKVDHRANKCNFW